MEVRERLARLVLHNVSAATYAARRLRQGTALELRLEPTAVGALQLIAFHDGRLLGRVEPIPREYIGWIRSCKDNRCTVDSIPVAQEDHLLKLILVRIERGEPIELQANANAEEPAAKPVSHAKAQPEPDAEPELEPVFEPELEPMPMVIQSATVPDYIDAPHYYAEPWQEPPPASALRRHGWKALLLMGFFGVTLAAASGVHFLNTPCGRLWAKLGGTSDCRVSADHNLYVQSSQPNVNGLCSPQVAQALPEVKLLRVTLTGGASPVLVTCRLNK